MASAQPDGHTFLVNVLLHLGKSHLKLPPVPPPSDGEVLVEPIPTYTQLSEGYKPIEREQGRKGGEARLAKWGETEFELTESI